MSVAVGAGHGLGSGAEPRTPPASPAPWRPPLSPGAGGGGVSEAKPLSLAVLGCFPPKGS